MERLLARVLQLGTLAATIVVAIGWALHDRRVEIAGVAAFIALPILRVAIMAVAFARARERTFALLALAVLAVIAVSASLA